MPAIHLDDVLMLERQSERLGLLWRSQGQKFLDEQAAALQEDVERLRASYLVLAEPMPAEARTKRRVRVPRVIDLRDPVAEILDRVCCTDGHGNVAAEMSCSRCHDVYCRRCILQSSATRDKPLCTECALVVAGVHHKRTRPAAASARSKH